MSAAKHARLIVALVCIGALALIAVAVLLDYFEGKRWKAFSAAHHCEEVGQIAGPGGMPSKTLYRCDDGKTYGR